MRLKQRGENSYQDQEYSRPCAIRIGFVRKIMAQFTIQRKLKISVSTARAK